MSQNIFTPEEPRRRRKKTVLAYGEGEDEKIFLRHLVGSYCRTHDITVQTSSAGGGTPLSILLKAIAFKSGEKRDIEFILLDTDKEWPEEMKSRAAEEGINLIGNSPCLEALFLDILETSKPWQGASTGRCKEFFEELCVGGKFNEEECVRLFPKAQLNLARERNETLDKILKIIDGSMFGIDAGN